MATRSSLQHDMHHVHATHGAPASAVAPLHALAGGGLAHRCLAAHS
ncbi:MAG: hypothetical protein ACOZE7_18615 [Pseudomonadota bacterium]